MCATLSFHTLTFLLLLLLITPSRAAITVYNTGGQKPTHTPSPSVYSGLQAFNPVEIAPPPLPTPPLSTKFDIQLPPGDVPGLSIKQSGAFMGFSFEFAVVSSIVGRNSTFLKVPFLNLMYNVQKRAGHVNIRLGGTSVDYSSLVDDLGGDSEAVLFGSAEVPPLLYTPELLYTLSNVSALLNIRWYLGIPFNETDRFRARVAEDALSILGDNLVGLQVGDQPDQYAVTGMRPYNYQPSDYMDEFGRLIDAMNGNINELTDYGSNPPNLSLLSRASKLLMGPNIISGDWTPEMVWWAGFPYKFRDHLTALTVAHYPSNNCFGNTGVGENISAESIFPSFLNHSATTDLVKPYRNSAKVAQEIAKPLMMIETNSASCGGFPGLSDSFGIALWALDYGLQMAYSNFSEAMFHVNGPNSSYNAFTPPSAVDPITRGWTVGPIYYSTLVMAEILGSSNQSQVLDLGANGRSEYTPAYAIYERGLPTKVALFNYITDPSGASDYVASISSADLGHGAIPPLVSVKYLSASSVSQKWNIMWAGQTFGGIYESDGRPMGTEDVKSISCSDGICHIHVPAPSFALVFLQSSTAGGGGIAPDAPTKTFPTTVSEEWLVSTTVDPAELETSNGRPRNKDNLGRTARRKKITSHGKGLRDRRPGMVGVLAGIVVGVMVGTTSGVWGGMMWW